MPDFDALCRSGGGRKIGRSAGKLPGKPGASGIAGLPPVGTAPAGTRDAQLAHDRADIVKTGATGTEGGPRGPGWMRRRTGTDWTQLRLPGFD